MDFSSGAGAHNLCCYMCATLFVLASFVTRAFSDTPPPDPIRPQLGVSDKLTSEYFNIFKLASEWPVFHFLFSSLFFSDRSKWDSFFLIFGGAGSKWHFWTILLSQRFFGTSSIHFYHGDHYEL